MTVREFSDGFDVLLDSYEGNTEFGLGVQGTKPHLNEYEKSVFLTNAQEQLVLSFYTGKNTDGDTFERTEEVRRYLAGLIRDTSVTEQAGGYNPISSMGYIYELPDDLWFITMEQVTFDDEDLGCMNGRTVPVKPVTQDDYATTMENPYRGPSRNRVLRLDRAEKVVEVVSKYNIGTYRVMYLRRPKPIVLEDLPDGLSINNIRTVSECELNSALHRKILELAVLLALASKGAGQVKS